MNAQAAPQWLRIAAVVFAVALAWLAMPALDLTISGWFYRPDTGFWLRDSWPAMLVYRGTRWMTATVIVSLLLALLFSLLKRDEDWRARRRRLTLTLLAIALGSGVLAHLVFKEQWGRPRPVAIAEFGGSGSYVAPGVPSRQCPHNCSFVSGHAIAGYALITGGLLWPAQRRRWLWIGLTVGSLIGVVRIVQGAHFFSDVLGSLAIVMLTNAVLEYWAQRRGWLTVPPG